MSSDTSITFETEFDPSGFEKGVKRLDSQIKSLASEVESAASSMYDTFGSKNQAQIDKLTTKLASQVNEINAVKKELSSLSSEYSSIASGGETPQSLVKMNIELNKINAAIEKEMRNNDRLIEQYGKINDKIKMSERLKSNKSGMQAPSKFEMSSDIDTKKGLSLDLDRSAKQLDRLNSSADKLRESMNRVEMNPASSKEAKKLAEQIEKANSKVNKLNTEVNVTERQVKKAVTPKPVEKLEKSLSKLIPAVNKSSTNFSKMGKSVETSMKRAGESVDRLAKRTIGSLAAIAGAVASGALMKDSVGLAMSVESSVGNINSTMRDSAGVFDEWVKSSAGSLGIATAEAYKYGSTYSNLLSSFTSSSKDTAEQTKELMKATAIISSKTGRTYEDTAERIRSGMLGSTEAIEDLGIYTNISMIESTNAFRRFAGDSSWAQLDFQTQQQIRLAAILEQTYTRYGDTVADTVQSRHSSLIASLQNVRLALGQAFLPIYSAILPALTAMANALTNILEKVALFTSMLFGSVEKATGSAGSTDGMYSMEEQSADTASTSVEKLGKEVDKTDKKIKKMSKSTQGFDQLNKLQDPNSDILSSDNFKPSEIEQPNIGNPLPLSGQVGNVTMLPEPDEGLVERYQKIIDKIKATIESIRAALQPTTDAFVDLWERGLKPLGSFTWDSLKGFYKHFLKPVGEWVFGEGIPRFINAITDMLDEVDWGKLNGSLIKLWDALAPFAINIGEGLLWLWENVLMPLAGWVVSDLLPAFLELLAATIEVLNSTIEASKPQLTWLWENFLRPMSNWVGDQVVKTIEGLTEALKNLSVWIGENEEIVGRIVAALAILAPIIAIAVGIFLKWGAIMGVITKVGNILTAVISGFGAAIGFLMTPVGLITLAIAGLILLFVTLWNKSEAVREGLTSAWKNIKEVSETFFNWIIDIIEEVLQPTWEEFVKKFMTVWTESIQPMFEEFADFAAKLIELAAGIINKVFSPIVNFLLMIFKPIWSTVFGMIIEIVTGLLNVITTVVGGIFKALGGLIDFLIGVFTGDWERALGGIKDIFKGIFNSLVGITAKPVNLIINIINRMVEGIVSGMNKVGEALNILDFDFPGWMPFVGGESFSLGLPRMPTPPKIPTIDIPKLAKGGLIPPRKPRQVIVGDNMVEDEIVSPVSTMEAAMAKVLAEQGGTSDFQLVALLMEIRDLLAKGSVIEMNDREFGRAVLASVNGDRRRTGRPMI